MPGDPCADRLLRVCAVPDVHGVVFAAGDTEFWPAFRSVVVLGLRHLSQIRFSVNRYVAAVVKRSSPDYVVCGSKASAVQVTGVPLG